MNCGDCRSLMDNKEASTCVLCAHIICLGCKELHVEEGCMIE